jgi:hypothetical protein
VICFRTQEVILALRWLQPRLGACLGRLEWAGACMGVHPPATHPHPHSHTCPWGPATSRQLLVVLPLLPTASASALFAAGPAGPPFATADGGFPGGASGSAPPFAATAAAPSMGGSGGGSGSGGYVGGAPPPAATSFLPPAAPFPPVQPPQFGSESFPPAAAPHLHPQVQPMFAAPSAGSFASFAPDMQQALPAVPPPAAAAPSMASGNPFA